MKYTLVIPTKILKKLKKLDKTTKERILDALEKISENPEKYKPLRYELKGKRGARVGKWRIIYEIKGDEVRNYFLFIIRKYLDAGIAIIK